MRKLRYSPLNIVVCGIGGQGNVLASEMAASALTELGYRVAVAETYGASQRGGSVMSHVRVSETDDLGVLIPSGEAHIILGFEPLEALRIARKYGNKQTAVVYDPRPIFPPSVLKGDKVYPPIEDIAKELEELCAYTVQVPATDIAMNAGNPKSANIVLLGALCGLEVSPLLPEEVEVVLKQRFKGAVLEQNLAAFEKGLAAVKGHAAAK